jgi:hypothetical protein
MNKPTKLLRYRCRFWDGKAHADREIVATDETQLENIAANIAQQKQWEWRNEFDFVEELHMGEAA